MTQATALETVPSVLPEGGLRLREELARYRDWIIDQALLRTGNNMAHAGELLGLSKSAITKVIRQRGIEVPPGPRGRYARQAIGVESPPSEPPPAEPVCAPAPAPAPKPPTGLAGRIDWAEVARLRSLGLAEHHIAQRLTWKIGANKWAIEKVLRARREAESESLPPEQQP